MKETSGVGSGKQSRIDHGCNMRPISWPTRATMFATPLCHAAALLSFTSSRARFGPYSGLIGRRFSRRMKARPNLGTMNERVKMRRWFHGAAETPLRRCAASDVGLAASLEFIGQGRGRGRTVAVALSTAPYLIPVCLTRARLIRVRPLSPSWLSARDNAVRACPSPRAASALPYLARTSSLALMISCI